MYYSEKMRKKKVQDLEGNLQFMDYARKSFEEQLKVLDIKKTFEQYLLSNVFTLYDDFTLLQFMQTADQNTINKVMSEALKNL